MFCVCAWAGWGESGQVPAVRWDGWKLKRDIYNHIAGPFISPGISLLCRCTLKCISCGSGGYIKALLLYQNSCDFFFHQWLVIIGFGCYLAFSTPRLRQRHIPGVVIWTSFTPSVSGVIDDITKGCLQGNGNEFRRKLLTVPQVLHLHVWCGSVWHHTSDCSRDVSWDKPDLSPVTTSLWNVCGVVTGVDFQCLYFSLIGNTLQWDVFIYVSKCISKYELTI